MQVVGVELAVKCKACATPVAINGLIPSARCDACSRAVPLLAPFWEMLFHGPIAESARAAMNHEQSSPFTTEEGVFHLVLRRTEAPAGLHSRPVPFGLTLPEIAQLVGEDVDQVVPERATKAEPQPLACPSCGGALQVSGDQRVVTCQYCQAQATLPDEIWQRLHPIRPVRRWYVVCAAQAGAARTTATWNKLTNVVLDDEGNPCCVGRLEEKDELSSVWSFGPEGTLRWVKRDLPKTRWSRTRIVAVRGGHLAVWERGHPTILMLRASDGETVAKIRGVPPGGPKPRYGPGPVWLDLDACDGLAFDLDGTMITNIGHELLRFSTEGALLPIWPDTPYPEDPLPGAYAPVIRQLASKPTRIMLARVFLGGDDLIYFHGSDGLAKLERGGLLHWSRMTEGSLHEDSRLGVDSRGSIFVAGDKGVVLLDRYGRPKGLLERRKRGGLLGDDEPALAVARDGTLHVFGHGGLHRRLGPDGKIAYISPASRASDDI